MSRSAIFLLLSIVSLFAAQCAARDYGYFYSSFDDGTSGAQSLYDSSYAVAFAHNGSVSGSRFTHVEGSADVVIQPGTYLAHFYARCYVGGSTFEIRLDEVAVPGTKFDDCYGTGIFTVEDESTLGVYSAQTYEIDISGSNANSVYAYLMLTALDSL